MVQTQFSAQVKSFQTDWGGEYRIVCALLESPEQNGSSKRKNRVIVEKGLALLTHSHLPKKC